MLDPALEAVVLVFFGLAIHAISSAFFPGNFRISGTLAGLTEGIIQQIFQSRRLDKSEPYLLIPYGSIVVCNLVDAAFTRNVGRVIISVVWACIGMVLADVAWAAPPAPTRAHFRRRSRVPESIAPSSSYATRNRSRAGDWETEVSGATPRASSEPPSFDGMYVRESPAEHTFSTLRSTGGYYDGEDLSPLERTGSSRTRSARSLYDGSELSRSEPFKVTRKGKGKANNDTYPYGPNGTPRTRSPVVENGDGEEQGRLSVLELTPVLPKLGFPGTFPGATTLSTIQSGDEVVTDHDAEPERLPPTRSQAYPLTPEFAVAKPVPPPQISAYQSFHALASPPRPNPSEPVDYASEASPPPSVISAGGRDDLISRAELIRQEAIEEERVRTGLGNEMREAVAAGRVKDAFLLKCEMEDAQMRAEKLHERAERRYYQAFNLSSKSWELDVHRLKVREATRRVEKMLRDMLLQNASTLRVIVGKGNHSAGNVPVLKQTILEHMARLKIPAAVDPKNIGVIIVTLPS